MSKLFRNVSLLVFFVSALAALSFFAGPADAQIGTSPTRIRPMHSNLPYIDLTQPYYNDGRCLGVRDGSTARGKALLQWRCNGKSSQQWSRLEQNVNGRIVFQVKNQHSNKCVGVLNTPGDKIVHQWDCNSKNTQLWKIRSTNSGGWQVESVGYPGYCWDIARESDDMGANLILYWCKSNPPANSNQLFKFY